MKRAKPGKAAKNPPRRRASSKRKGATKAATKERTKKAAKSAPKTVEEYLARVPEPARSALNQIRAAIRAEVPAQATEVLSYRIPAFKHKRVLVWYAAFSDHCSLFPTAAVIEQFKDRLKGFSTSRGTIHFPLDKPMPVALIRKIVRTRVKQEESRG